MSTSKAGNDIAFIRSTYLSASCRRLFLYKNRLFACASRPRTCLLMRSPISGFALGATMSAKLAPAGI